MRYILFILSILISQIANAQMVTQPGLGDYQMSGRNLPDSVLYILGTDTLDGSAKQGLGKFLTAESLRGFFKDTDWLKYRTGTIPTNTDTMYHVGVATVGEDSVYTGSNILTGKLNVVGRLDLRFGEVQDYNIMIGRNTGRTAMTGLGNIGMGNSTLDAATSGANNIAIGAGALGAATTSSTNVAIGPNAGYNIVAGSNNNLFLGNNAGDITEGDDNVMIGAFSGNGGSSGISKNIFIGAYSGNAAQGTNNVFIGYESGLINEGSNSVLIGYQAGQDEADGDKLYIENSDSSTPLIHGDFASDTLRINGDLSIRDAVSGASTDSVLVWTPSNGRVKMRNAAAFGGSGATDLSIAQSGATQVIQSSTGTDVGVRNLYGLLITEGATDTLHFRVDTSLLSTQYDITQIPISRLKAAIATNSIDNTTYKQEWKWDGIAGTDGLKLSSITTAAASDAQKLFNVTLSGTNGTSGQDTWAGYFSNTHAGTSSTNYGLYGIATNGTSANYGVYGEANGANGQGVTGTSSGNIGVLGIGAIGVYGSATSGAGVYSTATSGIAVSANATSGTGVEAIVTSGIPISVQDNSAGTNTVEPMIQMYHLTTGTAAAGIGSSIVYNNEAADGSDYPSNTLTSKWTTATAGSRVSDFVVSGVNAAVTADLLTIKGSGQIQLNKYTGGAFSGTAAYNVLIDASGNLIVGSVPVGSNNVTEENNAVVQSGTLTYDFQNPFDVATDGGTEVNISLDCGEFTTVTAIESDDFMLMHDSGTPANQKILWTDVLIDLIAFEDGNSSVGTGNTIDVGEGLDIDMSPSTEANINLDASEFQIDGTAEGTEYVLIHDADTTAGHQIQRRLVSSFSGGTDTNFAEDNLTWSANRTHDQSTYTTEIGGTNMTWKFQDNNATTGAQIILAGNVGNSDAPMGQIQFMYDDSGFATDQTAWTMVATRETDSQEHSTLEITANEASSAPPVATWEENENLSDNTQETSVRLNSGIAFTQSWESATTNAITLDRGYYNIVLNTGHTGTITLPQIYGIDESNIEIDAAQVPIGQEYVISNFSGSAVTIACFGDTGSANDDHLNGVENGTFSLSNNESVIVKAVAIISSEGRWFTYD